MKKADADRSPRRDISTTTLILILRLSDILAYKNKIILHVHLNNFVIHLEQCLYLAVEWQYMSISDYNYV